MGFSGTCVTCTHNTDTRCDVLSSLLRAKYGSFHELLLNRVFLEVTPLFCTPSDVGRMLLSVPDRCARFEVEGEHQEPLADEAYTVQRKPVATFPIRLNEKHNNFNCL